MKNPKIHAYHFSRVSPNVSSLYVRNHSEMSRIFSMKFMLDSKMKFMLDSKLFHSSYLLNGEDRKWLQERI